MKTVLIIYPHFPPSNLAGVHRARLFASHLPTFGWSPIVLTVNEKYYEEELDWNLVKLLPKELRIEKVNAFKITKPRIIGDIGLRAFFQIYFRAKELILKEKIDFIYIPVPSFYCALLGRMLNTVTGIKYGIDYIDPWVHVFPGSNKIFSRHWFSSKIAKILEPIAVKNVSLITGVAEGYYSGVLNRNKKLLTKAIYGFMPYGGEQSDHDLINSLSLEPYLFAKKEGVFLLVYAGAMLPKAYKVLEKIFISLSSQPQLIDRLEFHFVGTGSNLNSKENFVIKPLAEKYDLWQRIIFEYPQRIPYLDVLVHLTQASGIFILGSTEPHYTPSKTYQAVLSKKPIFAVLHQESSAVQVINNSNSGLVLAFNGENDLEKVENLFYTKLIEFLEFSKKFNIENVKSEVFEQYSAKNITYQLSQLLNQAILK